MASDTVHTEPPSGGDEHEGEDQRRQGDEHVDEVGDRLADQRAA